MFTHLAVRSEYAIVDSIVRIKELVKAAKQDGQTSLGIADLSNLFAAVKFYKACKEAHIKPILGSEVYIAGEDGHSVVLYAMNNEGYQNLLKLVSKTYTDGLKDGIAYATMQDIMTYQDGLCCILTQRSDIGSVLKSSHPERAAPLLAAWQEIFGDRLYIAIQRTRRAGETTFIKNAITQAHPLKIAIIAFNDVRFLHQDDFDAHEARVCIAGGWVLGDTNRPRHYSEEQYFKTQEQMQALFADLPTVIANTEHLAQRCNVTLSLGKNFLPNFPVPAGETMDSYFRKLCLEGLHQRLDKLYPKDQRQDDWQQIYDNYQARLDYELGVIIQMGFTGYFLIVMDFIRWAKENGVPVGPGRGSGAGSLVAYSLNITDLDPLAYDLLFERFLNPERVSMPDFDIDFCIDGRDRVIEYVAQKYGRDAVSQIITFGTMAARAVVRDVARVQGKPYGLADRLSKMIPKTPGISLAEAREEEVLLAELLDNSDAFDHEDALEIWEMAVKLEGIIRNVGKHAGGVLIAPGAISDFSAIYCDSEGNRVSQYDKGDVEAVGLVKFDFLGLRNLTVIKAALDNINQTRTALGEPPIDLDELPLDDPKVYQELLQKGKTSAVFQLESTGMKKYLKMLKPSNIEDVIAMCALYRPGPLGQGMVDTFINRKHGIEKVAYPHPKLESILSNTYGVIVYQEQVMQAGQEMAGYTLGGADMLRRAMGKKDAKEMAKQRSIFVSGATKLDIDEAVAGGVFDLMESFAEYGFNKSHSAAYGVLAYQTAYLKHYYPAEFMAAVLTSEMHNTDAVVFSISDCTDNFGLLVLPPSVHDSLWQFVAKDAKTIVYGLGAVKGVGEGAVASIVEARKQGRFKDLYDFCNRVDIKKVGKLALEALINSGSLDDLAHSLGSPLSPHDIRAGLWEQLPMAMKAAEQNRNNALGGTMDLFAQVDDALSVAPPLSPVIWRAKERLARENATLGLYLTGHPIDEYRSELRHYTKLSSLAKIGEANQKEGTILAGLIFDMANFGNRVLVKLDDGTARLELGCYADRYSVLKDILKVGEIIVAKVQIREHEGRVYTTLQDAFSLFEARLKHIKHINLKLQKDDTQTLMQLLPLLGEAGKTLADKALIEKTLNASFDDNQINHAMVPICLYLYSTQAVAKVMVNERFVMTPSDDKLSQLRTLFGEHNMVVDY